MTTAPPTTLKPRRRWLQFSLRRLLVVVLLACGFFGLVAQFGPLNVLVFVLVSAVVVGVAMSRRKRTMLEGKGAAERIRQQQAEYERRGGWARPFINGEVFLSIALVSVIGALWYAGLHDVGEYGGVFQFVAASLISYLLLCMAVICLTVTLLNFSKLPGTQRILGTLPIVLTGLVFLLMGGERGAENGDTAFLQDRLQRSMAAWLYRRWTGATRSQLGPTLWTDRHRSIFHLIFHLIYQGRKQ